MIVLKPAVASGVDYLMIVLKPAVASGVDYLMLMLIQRMFQRRRNERSMTALMYKTWRN
jgi:hypothetical protein